MRIKTYSSDLPAASWQVIKKIIQVLRRRKWDLKEVVNAVLYVTKNGCVWREVPGEFPPWQTVYYYLSKWVKDGTWKSISDCLTTDYREKQGKKSQPTVAIVDSQSAKNSATCGKDVGVDGGKLVKGRKRFYIVDTMGNLLDSFVVAANSHDGGPQMGRTGLAEPAARRGGDGLRRWHIPGYFQPRSARKTRH